MNLKNKTIKYKGKCIKMSEETWSLLKEKRIKSGKTWNKFLLDLIEVKRLLNND